MKIFSSSSSSLPERWAPKKTSSQKMPTQDFSSSKSSQLKSYRLKKRRQKSAEITYNFKIMLKLNWKPFIRMSIITLHVNPIIIVEMTREQYFGYKWTTPSSRWRIEWGWEKKKHVANSCFVFWWFFFPFRESKAICRNQSKWHAMSSCAKMRLHKLNVQTECTGTPYQFGGQ